jgi:hypothetical protein
MDKRWKEKRERKEKKEREMIGRRERERNYTEREGKMNILFDKCRERETETDTK